ncbi:MAG: hypothetical protein ACOX3K_04615 [Bacilli bacterium]|jgi:hypothetical protein
MQTKHQKHLLHLQKQGQYQEILTYISFHREQLLALDPILLLEIEVNALTELKRVDEREVLFKKYEDGPYISQEFDEALSALKKVIKRDQRRVKKEYTAGEIKRLLAIDSPYSQQLIAINYLQSVDPQPYLPLVRNLVKKARAIEPQLLGLFLLMKANDEERLTFTSCNLNRTHTVIPKELPLPLTSEVELLVLSLIETLTNNVTVNQFAKTIYQTLVFHLFPDQISREELPYLLIFLESEARLLLGEKDYPQTLLKQHQIDFPTYRQYADVYHLALQEGEALA